ncbi:rhomboid family intramembrane serine protease [Bacterioplanoides sp. SCSIO 12839]|uniref:rhomboid family intramembrane serine protease n=1 Tax=Bacterioplanoides sp. SCSIO 12839 TaxID=2829569 RepID=UPI0021074420|nr:rhomboid family intramembrane serine protease [Bacterioplanoides sp. SCSIO 12839]UTW49240.1 rhomboid family intramembrane serine protease [Bacterioplanoides sp. SCSIO 12839]
MNVKYCPHCRKDALDITHYHGEELDVCRKCGGVWFEHGELNSLLSAIDNGEDNSQYETLLGDRNKRTEGQCPSCPSHLHNFQLLKDYDVQVDICMECDGVWVEHDQLEKVEHSPRIRQSLDELNKKITVKSWLFQFLAKMPVEYNIKPHKKPLITWLLVILNTVIFFSYSGNLELENWMYSHFAYTPAEITRGEELWALITSVFLHGSLMHLVGNMYFLYIIGDNLEDVLGKTRYLLIYLVSGVGASLISVVFNLGSDIPNLGASGAISALFGMYLMWFRYASLSYMFWVYQKKISPVWYFAIWLVFSNIVGIIQGVQGIGFAAHIGGFVIGLGIGAILKQKVYRENPIVRLLSEESVRIQR